jgi:hypothetical protein
MINLGGQNEPPHKKQRTSDGTEPTNSNTPSQSQDLSMVKKFEIIFVKFCFYFSSVICTSNGSNVLDSQTFITDSY